MNVARLIQSLFALLVACTIPAHAQLTFDSSHARTIEAGEYEPMEFFVWGKEPVLSQITVVSDLNNPAPSNSSMFVGGARVIYADFLAQEMFGAPTASTKLWPTRLRLSGLPEGEYTLKLRYPSGVVSDQRTIRVATLGEASFLVPVGSNGPNGITLRPLSGIAKSTMGLEATAGRPIRGWAPASAKKPRDAVALYEFSYSFQDDTARSAALKFYTANESERQALRSAPGWKEERVIAYVLPQKAGQCAAYARPVFRAFRAARSGEAQQVTGNGTELSNRYADNWQPTHFYTDDPLVYENLANSDSGWSGEGVVFCSAVATFP
jgi:hypothetical protein